MEPIRQYFCCVVENVGICSSHKFNIFIANKKGKLSLLVGQNDWKLAQGSIIKQQNYTCRIWTTNYIETKYNFHTSHIPFTMTLSTGEKKVEILLELHLLGMMKGKSSGWG